MKTLIVPQLRFPGFKDEWKIERLDEAASVNPKVGKLPDSFMYIDLDSVKNGRLLKENRISRSNAPSRAQRLLQKKRHYFSDR